MEAIKRSFPVRYGIAALLAAVGVTARYFLIPWLGTDSPFIILFPAVALSALFGGFGAGLLTTVLGGFAANYLIADAAALHPSTAKDWLQIFVFLLMGAFVSWAVSDRGRISRRLAESQRETLESEKALEESQQKWLLAQRSAGVGVWELDVATNRAQWSEGVYRLLGLEMGDDRQLTENWQDVLLPEDRERVNEDLERALAEGRREVHYEYRVRRRDDGAVRWIATQAQVTRDADGKAVKLFGVNYDITERKEAELRIKMLNQELSRRIKELETIFDIAPVGIAVAVDPECNVIFANPALAGMIGVEPGANISNNQHELPYKHRQNGRELAPHELPMQRAVAEKRAIFNEEIEIVRADGRAITIYGYAAPIYDESGRVISCVAAQIDITERKKAELARERELDVEQNLRRQAEEANRLKDEFLATVSHELRTPLNAIIGWVTMLRGGRLPAETERQALEAVERSAKSQSQLIEDLLDVSRIISGKLKLQLQPIAIAAVVEAAVETIRPSAELKRIEIETAFTGESALISADFDRLQQVVWNLLSNAVKFTPEGGRVRVALARHDSRIELVVSDTGEGIKADFLPFVFDRFRQADGSSTRKYTGLGLGLAIVRHLVEAHGGTVGVESAGEGRGTTFRVGLPAAPIAARRRSDREPAAGIEPANDFPALEKLKILVVDDERDTLDILKIMFENCRAQVATAAGAAEAFDKLRSWRPDLIVSDIGMPDEDGFSLMRKIREWEKNSAAEPVVSIALTAYARSQDRRRATEAGFGHYVVKPVQPIELARLIASIFKPD